ncbi:hypothetical protein [Parvicella tangerina]|uniref:Uncharacterized protein n=1 Tax=Parvicella tangerina TaxID=2829795 RepID=A0A916NH18_9FLAO|nr:hypothetical protein [Parvicella tangerina]CAG5081810.1 hypothetical protein CRYO30217_01734 [Parvicella tangerina]
MNRNLIIAIFLSSSFMVYSQPHYSEQDQEFCNQIKESILELDFSTLRSALHNSLQKNADEITSICEQYSEYINSHSLKSNNYYGIKQKGDSLIQYGYRWASTKNISICVIELTCENLQIKSLVFSSVLGDLPSISFPKNQPVNFDVSLPPPPPPPGKK